MGLKSDKTTIAIIDELNKMQGINKSIVTQARELYPRQRYYNCAQAGEGDDEEEEVIELTKEFNEKAQVNDEEFIPLEDDEEEKEGKINQRDAMDIEDEGHKEFKIDKSEMSNRDRNLIETNKKYSKLIEEKPTDVAIWIDYCRLQDTLFKTSSIKISASVKLSVFFFFWCLELANKMNQSNFFFFLISLPLLSSPLKIAEKKLAILEKAMGHKEIERDPFLLMFYLKVLDSSNKNDDFYKVLHHTWIETLEKIPTNFYAWKLFLDFKFANFTKYSVNFSPPFHFSICIFFFSQKFPILKISVF